jgi:hypothetical protein
MQYERVFIDMNRGSYPGEKQDLNAACGTLYPQANPGRLNTRRITGGNKAFVWAAERRA